MRATQLRQSGATSGEARLGWVGDQADSKC